MTQHMFLLHRFCLGIVLYSLLSIWALPAVYGAAAESFDELHQKATKEGGKLTIYAALSAASAPSVLPAMRAIFPGA
jgi:hypothetical protein